jgi:hypothetical protein
MNARNCRKFLNYGKPAGKDSLPRPPSVAQDLKLHFPRPRILQQLLFRHHWDFRVGIPNLRPLSLFHSNKSSPPRQTRFRHLLPLILHPSASPLCPTSRSQIPLTMSLPSTPLSLMLLITSLPSATPRPQPRTRLSILRTGAWKCYAEALCSVFTLASCSSTLLPFVGCSLGPV